jgi:hypothetical protein
MTVGRSRARPGIVLLELEQGFRSIADQSERCSHVKLQSARPRGFCEPDEGQGKFFRMCGLHRVWLSVRLSATCELAIISWK